jgi:hypothetical protein
MVPAPMSGGAMSARLMDMLSCRQRRCIRQVRGEHQYKGRNDAESQKCVKRRQDGAQISAGTARKIPGKRPCSQAANRRNRARTGGNFQPCLALQTRDVVGIGCGIGGGYFGLAMRTDANGHASPLNRTPKNRQIFPQCKEKAAPAQPQGTASVLLKIQCGVT